MPLLPTPIRYLRPQDLALQQALLEQRKQEAEAAKQEAEARDAANKARLADPLEAAKAAATTNDFLTRRDVAEVGRPTMMAPPPSSSGSLRPSRPDLTKDIRLGPEPVPARQVSGLRRSDPTQPARRTINTRFGTSPESTATRSFTDAPTMTASRQEADRYTDPTFPTLMAGREATARLTPNVLAAEAVAAGKSNTVGGPQGLQRARADSAAAMLERLRQVHAQLQTGEGPSQIARGLAAATGGRINLNNPATEYQKLRKATAVALAVAIQGSRPSDKDAEAMADLLPDFNTPAEVADHLFESSKNQLRDTSAAMGGNTSNRSGTIRARDPQGVLHEASAGTPLPAGWKAEP